MKDITNILRKAIETNIVWSINLFFTVIESIEEIGFKISYWKNEENWASILVDGKAIGYVWRKYPLIFILSKHIDKIKLHLKEYDYITYIAVSSLIDDKFRIDYTQLKGDVDFGLTDDGFSAEDFWFHTNSV